MKTSKIVLITSLFLISFGIIFILIVSNSYKYKITYQDKTYTYEITAYEKIIKVIKKENNNTSKKENKLINTNEYKINFMREGMDILYSYLDTLEYNNRYLTINYQELNNNSFPIFNSIINNNEELLNYTHKIEYYKDKLLYNIYFDKDYNIKILSSNNNSKVQENYKVVFSKKTKEYLKTYLEKNLFSNNFNISIKDENINKEMQNIIYAIITSNEEIITNKIT